MGFKGIGSALSRGKGCDSSGAGGMAVKVMTDGKQQTAKILGRKWRKLMLTAVMVSGESRAAVAGVLVHLQPFSVNSLAYKSIELFPHFEQQLSNLPKILKEQVISFYFPTFQRLHCVLASVPIFLQKLPSLKSLVFLSIK